ncbi:MAG: hypothetical protein AAF567_10450 [Actinomycetota bacterium]
MPGTEAHHAANPALLLLGKEGELERHALGVDQRERRFAARRQHAFDDELR